MFIAMNRFRVAPGREEDFVRVWEERESYLHEMEGFSRFRLLHGPAGDEHTLFISYTEWVSAEAFRAWTDSEQFVSAHRKGRTPEGVLLGHPEFEGFEVRLEQA